MVHIVGSVLALAAFPSVLGAMIQVQVGAGGNLAFDPPFVNANPGDVIDFIFNPKNHTVTQSSFSTPCSAADGGFKTGFVPVSSGTVMKPFTVPETSAPLWFYCGQVGHCAAGMVFAINPPADPAPNSFSAFKALAMGQAAPSPNSPSATPSSTPATSPSTYVTPPPPHWQTATATVTWQGSTYTTTYSSYDGTPPPTPAAAPVDHKIIVGANGNLSYDPPSISASIGDTVTFEFHPKNHTVTQSSFLNPCTSLEATTGVAGFKSGFQPVGASDTSFPTFQIRINDTAPIWGYCGQTNHCSSGMVFAINAVESGPNNFAAFQQLAKQTAPSSTPAAGSPSASGSATSPSPTPTGGALSNAVSLTALSMLSAFGLLASML